MFCIEGKMEQWKSWWIYVWCRQKPRDTSVVIFYSLFFLHSLLHLSFCLSILQSIQARIYNTSNDLYLIEPNTFLWFNYCLFTFFNLLILTNYLYIIEISGYTWGTCIYWSQVILWAWRSTWYWSFVWYFKILKHEVLINSFVLFSVKHTMPWSFSRFQNHQFKDWILNHQFAGLWKIKTKTINT